MLWTDLRDGGRDTTADLPLHGVDPLDPPNEDSLEEEFLLGVLGTGVESLSMLVVNDFDFPTTLDWGVGVGECDMSGCEKMGVPPLSLSCRGMRIVRVPPS